MNVGDLAHARSGDKGSDANIGVIAYGEKEYAHLLDFLTEERVAAYFVHLEPQKVTRYEWPSLLAMNFLLVGVLQGGGSLSLKLDNQGKTLAVALLQMPMVPSSYE